MLLNGCSNPWKNDAPVPLEIKTKPIERPELVLPKADQIDQREVKWILITAENYEKVFEKLKKNGHPPVLFGLTDDGYGKLALNISDIRMYISQQQTIIAAYKNYYIKTEETLDSAVTIEE